MAGQKSISPALVRVSSTAWWCASGESLVPIIARDGEAVVAIQIGPRWL
jgi:hypothetical protein